MNLQSIGFVILSDDVKTAAAFYTKVLGFDPLVTLDWYASLQQPKFQGVYLDIIKKGHEAAGEHLKDRSTTGTMLALIVDDIQKEYDRIVALGINMIMDIKDEPWGQRRCQFFAPDNVVVELIQRIEPDMDWIQTNT